MIYIVVLRDKIVHRWDMSDTDNFSGRALLLLSEEDWKSLVGEPDIESGETFEQKEVAYVTKRGWTLE